MINIMSVNPKYLKGLSKEDKEKKTKNIKKTQKLLKEGKKEEAIKESKKRPTVKSSKKSSYTEKFRKKYGDIKVPSKELAEKTGLSLSSQKKIIKKGEGAFLSAGSRSTVSSAKQWGLARLFSVITGGKARKIDKAIWEKDPVKWKK